MENILYRIREMLAASADDKTIANGQKAFREKIKTYGIKIPAVHAVAKKFQPEVKTWNKNEIFALCTELWKSGYLEESFIACDLSYHLEKKFQPEDFELFKDWVFNYVNNWASCDTLCNHTIETFVELFPDYAEKIKNWGCSDNRWARRATAVTFIIPARKGLFYSKIIEIADILLEDEDDLVQKGYGWMLKAASQYYPKEVFEYVLSKKTIMPRTAFRYSIEKLPDAMRKEAMKK